MTTPSEDLLFMGEQEDPEMKVWRGRGLRIYDGTGPDVEDLQPLPPRTPRPGPPGMIYTHRNGVLVECSCAPGRRGSCLFGAPCLP